MSINQYQKIAVALATVASMGIASSTFAAGENKYPAIELPSTNLTTLERGCVATTPGQPGLTAYDKLLTILTARNQFEIGAANKLTATEKRLETIFTTSKDLTGKGGFIITSNNSMATEGQPKDNNNRTNSARFCFDFVKYSSFENVATLDKVPVPVNDGILGVALNNQNKLGSKVAVHGMYPNGSLFVFHYNPNDLNKLGSLKESNATGGQARDVGTYHNFRYSDTMKKVFALMTTSNK